MSSVPTWERFMAPALRFLSDGEVHRAREIRQAVAHSMELSDEAREELIPSGQLRWENRANWALSYLGRYGAAERPSRGRYRITDAGRRLLEQRASGVTTSDLARIVGVPAAADEVGGQSVLSSEASLEPREQIETGIEQIHTDVAAELLKLLHNYEPAFFEQAVLDLLIAMGYGGAEGAATRTQLSNDGGIDGIVDQDALGLSRIYVQAKRYAPDASVGRPEIQAFVGALQGNQANQGVFITTGRFSAGAVDYAANLPSRVILIGGSRLTRLMITYGVGVQVESTYRVVKVDEDYFE